MRSVELSDKELEVIIASLRQREDRMFKDAQAYRDQGNKLAQMDCIEEMHLAQHLRERIQKLK